MFSFQWPLVFLILPLPLLCYWLLPAKNKNDQAAIKVPFFKQWSNLSQSQQAAGEINLLKIFCMLMAWLLLVCAAARPEWIGDPIKLPANGRDLLLAVDVSGSMEHDDMLINGYRVSRLTAAKSVLTDFIARREGDRVGLILFSQNAYLQAPLSFDRVTVNQLLQESFIHIAGTRGTTIGDAIGLGIKQLKDRPANNRILILLTDGAHNIGEIEPVKAAELAKQAGVKIYTIGVGNPDFFGRTDLDEPTLIKVANITTGKYFRARNTQELEQIYAYLDELEPIESEAETIRPIISLFHYFSALALLLMFLPYLASFIARLWPKKIEGAAS